MVVSVREPEMETSDVPANQDSLENIAEPVSPKKNILTGFYSSF